MNLERGGGVIRARCILLTVLLALGLSSCGVPVWPAKPTGSPAPTQTCPAAPAVHPQPTETPLAGEREATVLPYAPVVRVEPTSTPYPGESGTSVEDLPIGEPGHYVNVAFGYWLQYPSNWYTAFGNRPLLASFSNLNPGTHNRASMRAEGCLIQVNASINVYGSMLQDLMAQGLTAFPNARTIDLDGEAGLLIPPDNEEDRVQSETVMISHDDVLFIVTLDYATDSADVCHPAWENMLGTWTWFTPEFAVYRNAEYAYAISYPRHWYRFNATERGIYISSLDPTGMTDLVEFLREAMLVQTDVFENPENLTLKEWLAQKDWDMDLTNDIPLYGELVGVRAVGEGPATGIQMMIGYFEGPMGEVYGVMCYYPADQQWEFRPIANAIIYSFTF
ncbi:MAG: hypothetical protein WBB22_06505 [Anaerolineae bacterium]